MSRLYPDRPFVGVGAVVLNGERVLLARRGNPPRAGDWSLPGGAQMTGETVFEAACREVREETGLDVEVLGVVDVVDSITRDDDGRVRYHYTLIDVVAEAKSHTATAGDDAAAVGWFSLDELGRMNLWSETERIIRLGYEMRAVLRDSSNRK
ncbi:MAG: NUDIX hydrolase [Rhodospirillales bacterium]|jgi:ADP-ribose pyrophosphatase YjhB (NUDIX family)|nr:NUDIX hydrolase [Rhodospirillales bacterium]